MKIDSFGVAQKAREFLRRQKKDTLPDVTYQIECKFAVANSPLLNPCPYDITAASDNDAREKARIIVSKAVEAEVERRLTNNINAMFVISYELMKIRKTSYSTTTSFIDRSSDVLMERWFTIEGAA